ncbi:hypothetical protein TNCV_3134181 [Trichonephila clavipes]|nr:hypothetical protein TNCV_3134181 [Trichonephila clavipes]
MSASSIDRDLKLREQKRCVAFRSRRESISGENPTSFLEDTSMPYSGFEPEPTRFQAEYHNHHTLLLFPIPLEQENLHQIHFTFPRNSVTHQALLIIQLSQGNAPAVQKRSRRSKERAGIGKERLYPLHKSHTTQVTASKARHVRLMIPGTPALYR